MEGTRCLITSVANAELCMKVVPLSTRPGSQSFLWRPQTMRSAAANNCCDTPANVLVASAGASSLAVPHKALVVKLVCSAVGWLAY